MTLLEQMGNAWRIQELRRKLLITLGLLALCRVGAFIPLPGVDIAGLQAQMAADADGLGVLGLLNMFSGGALEQGAIFGLGIMPFITAQIIFQLLGSVIPSLEKLRKEGAAGYRKLNQYTRLSTLFVCFLQGTIILRALMGADAVGSEIIDPALRETWLGVFQFVITGATLMTAGTMFLMWLGEQIDQHGIGNGVSLIIMVSIITRLPAGITELTMRIRMDDTPQNAMLKVGLLIGLFVAVVIAIVFVTLGERRIPVQQQKHVRGPKVYGGQKHYLPLRVNTAGVMPIIFAAVLLQFPQMIASSARRQAARGGIWYRFFVWMEEAFGPTGTDISLTYVVVYALLIFFFCYFWTAVVFNPRDMSENLQNHGSFIPGIRPGRRTSNYLEAIMNRVTLAGAFFLVFIALLPTLVMAGLGGVGWGLAGLLGGTSILIVVGVTLDLVRQINDHLEMRRYSGFGAGAGGRRRSRRR